MNTSPIYDRIEKDLENRVNNQQFRTCAIPLTSKYIDLSTNSYLNIQSIRSVSEETACLADNCYSGNLASRLIDTRSGLYPILETELAEWKKTESALLFNSGYSANVGIIQAICNRHTVVFSDRLNHASIIDGILLSGAVLVRYNHCDMDDLKNKIVACDKREKMIVSDSVFSMDGNVAPCAEICSIAKQYKCMVLFDEAHATGIFGKTLCGLVEQCGVSSEVDIIMGTLSKAIAGMGGFFAGSTILRDYFVNKARSLIYSTALPQSVLAHNIAAIRFIRAHPQSGPQLLDRAENFRKKLKKAGFNTLRSSSHIIPIITKSEAEAIALSQYLREKGIKAPAIRPPTVPIGLSRIRMSIHAGCSDSDLHTVLSCLVDWKKEHGQ